MSKSVYCLKDNRLIIFDEKLDISIDIEFYVSKDVNPKLLGKDEIYEIKEYYPSKELKAQRYYHQDRLHGPSTYFYENGQVASKIWYVNGEKQGKCYQYYKSSRIYSLQRYKNNLKQNIQKYFYEDGALKSELFYVDNLLDKKMMLFWENEKVKREVSFSNGKRHGFDKIFSIDQKLLFIGEYNNDRAVGSHKSYDEKGVIREKIIYNGNDYKKCSYDHLGNLIDNE